MGSRQPSHVMAVDIDGNTHQVALTDLRWRPSAYGIIIDNGNVLVLKQRSGYDLPGGGVDFGEMPDAAAVREVKEESGIDVANPKLVGAASTFFKFAHVPTGEAIQSIMLYYACDYIGGEISNEAFDEHEHTYVHGAEWWPLSELDELPVSSSNDFRPYIRELVANSS